ncbi:MAG: glutamate-1-semialdehyde 2,1-aminomutase [Planctomycetota bacterium]
MPTTADVRTGSPNPPSVRSDAAFERAAKVLVGGVNSPVRAFGSVGGTPRVVASARGATITDIDGRTYLDLVGSWGPAIVGHAHPAIVEAVRSAGERGLTFGAPCEAETELAELILGALPGAERVRFVNSGTEAGMSAVRLARAATSRTKLIKFAGNYHGHTDALLVAAGSGAETLGVPDSAGVTPTAAADTLTARYNDLDDVDRLLRAHGADIAAILVEPVAGNMGFVQPAAGFLEGLRERCDRAGCLLVFDEVMTGFRVAWGGAQTRFNIRPDLTCLGKVMGGGMPVAAYAGPARIMELVAPVGPVYQAGTLSGNPIGMAAGLATLTLCKAPGFYDKLEMLATRLVSGLVTAARACDIPVAGAALGGMLGFAFSAELPTNLDEARSADHERFRAFFHAMLDAGVWLPPSPYEALFLSSAHTAADIEAIIACAQRSFRQIG